MGVDVARRRPGCAKNLAKNVERKAPHAKTPHAQPAMELLWSPLSLKTIPLLQDEVDVICSVYKKSPSEALYRQISFRADELHTFFLEHEHDVRSVLILGMRTRLLQALQRNALQASNDQQIFDEQEQEEEEEEEEGKEEDEVASAGHDFDQEKSRSGSNSRRKRLGQDNLQVDLAFTKENTATSTSAASSASAASSTTTEDSDSASSPELSQGSIDERTFAHEYAATRAPTTSSKGHVEVVSKRAAKNTAAYPWERRQRLQDRNFAGSDSCKTRLDPSQEADLVAAISYAAAHQGDSTLPFTSPFAKEKLLYPTKDQASDTSSSNEANLARNRIVARFTIKLSKDEYYEVMRRKEVIKARERARHLLAVHEKESEKHREHLYRREDPYEPPQTRELGSKLRQADPSRWIHSKGFAA